MRISEFRRAGHTPSLVAALLHFDVSFAIWVLLGALGAYIAEDLGLNAAQKGVLVAIPLLSAAVCRVTFGILADRFGPRRIGTISMTIALLPLVWGWLGGTTMDQMLGVGVLLGVAGASFAISLPLASRWYPPQHQGLAMGIAGAGNSGSLLATIAAPRLAERFGWAPTFGLMVLPVLIVTIIFALLAKDSPQPRPKQTWRDYTGVLKEPDALWFCFLYALTFGGFVGFTSFLTTFFNEQYHVSKVSAGDFTTLV